MGMPANQRTVERLVDEFYAALYRYAFRLAGSAAESVSQGRTEMPAGRLLKKLHKPRYDGSRLLSRPRTRQSSRRRDLMIS